MTQTRFCRNNWKPKGKNTYTRRTFFLTLWLSVNLGVQEKGCIKTYNWFCWHAYAMDKKIASSVSLRWYQIGQNTWHYLEFLTLIFTVWFFFWYFVGNGTSNASQLSRNKIQEEGGAGGTCNCIIILLFFFTTKLSNEIVEHFYLIKQIWRFYTFFLIFCDNEYCIFNKICT